MVVVTRYAIRHDRDRDVYVVRSSDISPPCPSCGASMRSFGHRLRRSIDGAGVSRWYELQRLRCDRCRSVHLELPDFIIAGKYYDRSTIQNAVENRTNDCPAEDTTIWRWKKEAASRCNLSCRKVSDDFVVDSSGTDTKEE